MLTRIGDQVWVCLNMSMAQVEYEVKVQLLEIYNEQLRDLLDYQRSERRSVATKLDIRTTERSGLNVPGARQVSHHS